jgi:hypothetical protein
MLMALTGVFNRRHVPAKQIRSMFMIRPAT